MSEHLNAAFPGLQTSPFRITSPADPLYNCIAWAAGNDSDWWWPLEDVRKTYWPPNCPRQLTLDAFTSAFAAIGYLICEDETSESGFERVAIFVDTDGKPTHAARQLPNGRWTSKLGLSEDIEHELRALEGEIYGSVAVILRRRITMES